MPSQTFTVELPMPPSLWRLYQGQGRQRRKSEKYRKWVHDAGWIVLQTRGDFKKISDPIALSLRLCPQSAGRRGDLDNRFKPCLDILTSTRTIIDDRQVIAINARWIENGPPCLMTVSVEI